MPTLESRDWLQVTGTLAGLALALASFGSALVAGRNQMRLHALEKEIVAVDLSAVSSDSVSTLSRLRAEVCAAVKFPWWRKGVVNTTKWRSIDALIEQRIALARQLQARALAKEIENIDTLNESDPAKARNEYDRVRNSVKKLFGTGELDGRAMRFSPALASPISRDELVDIVFSKRDARGVRHREPDRTFG